MKEDVLSRMCSQQNNGRAETWEIPAAPKCEGRHLCDRNPGISQAAVLQEFLRELLAGVIRLLWSNYSDLTRPHPKWWFSKGNPLISGKSRLVKYYNLARLLGGGFKYFLLSHLFGEDSHFDEHIFQRGCNHQLDYP